MEVEGTEDMALSMDNLDSPPSNTAREQEQVELQFRHKLATDLLSIMTTAMEDACFSPCVPKAGQKTSKSNERCFKSCMEHFWTAWNITSDTVQRISAKIGQSRAEGME